MANAPLCITTLSAKKSHRFINLSLTVFYKRDLPHFQSHGVWASKSWCLASNLYGFEIQSQ